MSLADEIKFYYEERELTFPNFDNAMKFVITELGEVFELDIDRSGTWVRNNPENKEKFSKPRLAEELGDTIFMLMVAGMTEGVDPLEAMREKMARKLAEVYKNKLKTATGISEMSGDSSQLLDKNGNTIDTKFLGDE